MFLSGEVKTLPRGKVSNTKEHEKQIIIYELIGIALVALALIIFVSIYAMSQDYITYNSNPGTIGGFLVKVAASLMGKGKILLPFTLLYIGYRYIKDNIGIKYDLRTLGAMLLLASILIVLHINVEFINVADNIKSGFHGQGGGILGAVLVVIFRTFFGLWGTWIISGAFFIAGIILTSGFSLKKSSCSRFCDSFS